MSMNLNAAVKNYTLDLWQTPTQITYTILPRVVGSEVKGAKAKEALTRYMEWIAFSSNGIHKDQEAYEKSKQNLKEHLEYLTPYLEDKTLKVWVM